MDLSTNNRDVARPTASSVTVAAGSTTATFTIESTTVAESQDVQITARYLSVAINQILRVTIIPPAARFVVTGGAKGENYCTLQNSSAGMDCRLDARTSGGFLKFYIWTYTVGSSTNTDTKGDAEADIEVKDHCDLFKDRSTATDSDGAKYLNMDIGLVVEDREGTRSSKTTKTVRVYVNGYCGY